MKFKLTIYCYHDIVAELIGPSYQYVYDIWVKWCAIRYAKCMPLGGSTIQGIE